MYWLDWIIIVIPLFIVLFIGLKSQKYVKGVADFLAAGRVAGRYVLSVAGGEAGLGLISIIAIVEMNYSSGFGVAFWSMMTAPITLLFALTGYQSYRFRETNSMTMGQFLELRYSRSFRIFAAVLQSVSGILNYAIFPAVGARFLIYFLDLPIYINIFGWNFPTFGLTMAFFLTLAVIIATMGGQITIMVTDCVMGILSYPMYLILVIYIIFKMPWFSEMYPTLLERPAGEDFLNPFDIHKFRDFNLFYVLVGICSSFFNRLSWSGAQGYNAAARSAHEQKMGGLLGTWRAGFSSMMVVFIALAAYVYMHHTKHVDNANDINKQLAIKTAEDILSKNSPAERDQVLNAIKTAKPRIAKTVAPEKFVERKVTNKEFDNYHETGYKEICKIDKSQGQTFQTIHNQMLVPLTMREMLPMGITGLFCAVMIFLMISTDTTYMHSWGSILVQDIFLPLYGKAISPKVQLNLLRLAIAFVAIFAFIFSFYFAQLDYILMFFAITGAIWLGGSGICITFGLYWKRGTTAGAFAALLSGAILAVGGIILQQTWADSIYPWLTEQELIVTASQFFEYASKPFCGLVDWSMRSNKFPINSQQWFFMTMLVANSLYIIVSLCTCKTPFNMDRMLHRGIYSKDGKEIPKVSFSLKTIFLTMTGVNAEYTRGDKILAWSVFLYSFFFNFILCFVGILVWNIFDPWTDSWWGMRFFLLSIVVPGVIGVVSTVWFTIGGTIDLRALFRDLKSKEENALDDGRVIGNVSASDLSQINKIDK